MKGESYRLLLTVNIGQASPEIFDPHSTVRIRCKASHALKGMVTFSVVFVCVFVWLSQQERMENVKLGIPTTGLFFPSDWHKGKKIAKSITLRDVTIHMIIFWLIILLRVKTMFFLYVYPGKTSKTLLKSYIIHLLFFP